MEDTADVAVCISDEYNDKYIKQIVYNPEAFCRAIREGAYASFLIVSEDGEPAGHLGLTMDPNLAGVWEIGMAVVRKKYRGLKLMDRLNDAVMAYCQNAAACRAAMRCSVTVSYTHLQDIVQGIVNSSQIGTFKLVDNACKNCALALCTCLLYTSRCV